MAAAKKKKPVKTGKVQVEGISFDLQPGKKVHLTIEAGQRRAGKIPVTVQVDEEPQIEKRAPARRARPRNTWLSDLATRARASLELLPDALKRYDLATWLFFGAVALYLATRLIGLSRFPIFFFTDEALQTQFAADLVSLGYRDANGHWFPPAFRNGDYYTLGMGVYTQLLPYLIFGKSAVVTRATSVLVTAIAAISLGVILRDVLKMRYWWTATLFLSITPGWFLHSRTAWETAEFVGLYTGALCAYLLYRTKSTYYLYLSLFFGALAFYTYSPAQAIVPVTALALVISDWRYHLENRRTVLRGLLLLGVLMIQYVRFRLIDPDNAVAHLHTLSSYLFDDISLWEKIRSYFSEYFYGMGPAYWYVPNSREFTRQTMKGYGNIMMATLPFAIIGLAHVIRHVRETGYRAVLISFLTAPVAGALVATGITRSMAFVIPVAIVTAIGLERVLLWVESPRQQMDELGRAPRLTWRRGLVAGLILLLGTAFASLTEEMPNQITAVILAGILALQGSGFFSWFVHRIRKTRFAAGLKKWSVPHAVPAVLVFVILACANLYMFADALRNGPTWYSDYGLGGMQYGGFQMFDIIEEYQKEHPQAKIVFTPNWANGTDVIARFFTDTPLLPFEMGSIEGWITQQMPLDENTVFVMQKSEYELALGSDKLADVRVEKTVPYPDGTPGFYFVRLRYSDKATQMFTEEKEFRSILQEGVIKINGEDVKVRHTYLEAGDYQNEVMQLVFDGDPYSLAKTFEANPFVIELTWPSVREFNGFSIVVGSARVAVMLEFRETPEGDPVVYTFEGQGQMEQPELSFAFPETVSAQIVHIEMLDVNAVMPAKDHIWEITFR